MSIPQGEYPTQLRMVWPAYLLDACPTVQLPPGYRVRPYQDGDEPRFFTVMELAGWPGWDADRLGPWQQRLLPQSWFMVVHEDSHELVATGMALRDCCEFGQQGGEIGWIAVDPAHRGTGTGLRHLGCCHQAADTRRLPPYSPLHGRLAACGAENIPEAGVHPASVCARHDGAVAHRLFAATVAVHA